MGQYINMIDSDLGIVSKSNEVSMPNTDFLIQSPLDSAVKEMFNERKIRMITDLDDDEIKLVTRIMAIADLKKIDIWRRTLDYYLELVLSRKRSSRKELLQAIEGTQRKAGFFESLNPANWGNRQQQR